MFGKLLLKTVELGIVYKWTALAMMLTVVAVVFALSKGFFKLFLVNQSRSLAIWILLIMATFFLDGYLFSAMVYFAGLIHFMVVYKEQRIAWGFKINADEAIKSSAQIDSDLKILAARNPSITSTVIRRDNPGTFAPKGIVTRPNVVTTRQQQQKLSSMPPEQLPVPEIVSNGLHQE